MPRTEEKYIVLNGVVVKVCVIVCTENCTVSLLSRKIQGFCWSAHEFRSLMVRKKTWNIYMCGGRRAATGWRMGNSIIHYPFYTGKQSEAHTGLSSHYINVPMSTRDAPETRRESGLGWFRGIALEDKTREKRMHFTWELAHTEVLGNILK